MKAVLNDVIIAEAPKDELISIEGNWYFPPESLQEDILQKSPTPYTCPWKGECQYFSIQSNGMVLQDRAWSYPTPYPSAFDRVGRDFSGYVAFAPDVQIVD